MVAVSDDVIERIADARLTAHLATARDGRPHVAPVWYLYDETDGAIRIVTAGRKLADIRANPYVSLSIEQSDAGVPEWTVTLHGQATVVDDPQQFDRVNQQINRKYGVEDDSWDDNTLVEIAVGSAALRTY